MGIEREKNLESFETALKSTFYHFIASILDRPNTGLVHFKYVIDAVLSWFEIKFTHFWGGRK